MVTQEEVALRMMLDSFLVLVGTRARDYFDCRFGENCIEKSVLSSETFWWRDHLGLSL